jgi:protein-L-isoaspartate O-methyltransferase
MSTSERLHELASELSKRADETIEQSNDALQNTARRAEIQAGVRGRAFADQALARTMHSIAEALSRGEAKYLDGIRHKSHVETLDTLLRLAKWARIRKVGRPGEDYARQPNLLDVRFTEYPYPCVYKRHLEEVVAKCRSCRGVKQASQKMDTRLSRENDEYVTFQADHDMEALEDFLTRARAAGLKTEWVDASLEKYKRLKRANITDIHEQRAALREYIGHRTEARGDDPVKVAERELIGKELPGFFPTPLAIIERMLALAEIEPHHLVLEPSCGKGDILDALRNRYADLAVVAIEQNRTLADILSAKGHEVQFGDFLEHRGQYDRILMNPPFESGADMEHIRFAFDLLRNGGKLVSVVSEGPFFRADKRSVAYRDWLDDVGAEIEQLPDGSFAGEDVFRQSSVRTRLVTITKNASATSA